VNKIIFLDRDGIINQKSSKVDYIKSWEEFRLLPGVIEALQLLRKNNFKIFIVTNQAGIARGLMSEIDLLKIHNNLLSIFKLNNIQITKIYYCPHGWNDGCDCRKPKPGMLLQAAMDFKFDIKKAIFIGDDDRDKQAGDSVGCRTILMKPNGNLLEIVKSFADNS
jgi:histidinol-phosphate phosphatase family protein